MRATLTTLFILLVNTWHLAHPMAGAASTLLDTSNDADLAPHTNKNNDTDPNWLHGVTNVATHRASRCDHPRNAFNHTALSSSACFSCTNTQRDTCCNPPLQIFHTYIDTAYPRNWHSNLLAIQAFLLTQNLMHARLVLWVTDADSVQLHPEAASLLRYAVHSSPPESHTNNNQGVSTRHRRATD